MGHDLAARAMLRPGRPSDMAADQPVPWCRSVACVHPTPPSAAATCAARMSAIIASTPCRGALATRHAPCSDQHLRDRPTTERPASQSDPARTSMRCPVSYVRDPPRRVARRRPCHRDAVEAVRVPLRMSLPQHFASGILLVQHPAGGAVSHVLVSAPHRHRKGPQSPDWAAHRPCPSGSSPCRDRHLCGRRRGTNALPESRWQCRRSSPQPAGQVPSRLRRADLRGHFKWQEKHL